MFAKDRYVELHVRLFSAPPPVPRRQNNSLSRGSVQQPMQNFFCSKSEQNSFSLPVSVECFATSPFDANLFFSCGSKAL